MDKVHIYRQSNSPVLFVCKRPSDWSNWMRCSARTLAWFLTKLSFSAAPRSVLTFNQHQPNVQLLHQCFRGVSAIKEPGVHTNHITATSSCLNGEERRSISGPWPIIYSERLKISSGCVPAPSGDGSTKAKLSTVLLTKWEIPELYNDSAAVDCLDKAGRKLPGCIHLTFVVRLMVRFCGCFHRQCYAAALGLTLFLLLTNAYLFSSAVSSHPVIAYA